MNKKDKNILSLVIGIILILIGASGTSISLAKLGLSASVWVISPFISFIAGIILAYLGAERKW